MSRKKRRRNPAPESGTWVKYALIAGGAYLILRALRNRGTLGNGGYGKKPEVKPVKQETTVERFTSSLPWLARAGLTVAETAKETAKYAGSAASDAAKWVLLPSGVSPDWKSANADLIAKLERERAARLSAEKYGAQMMIDTAQMGYGAAKPFASAAAEVGESAQAATLPLRSIFGAITSEERARLEEMREARRRAEQAQQAQREAGGRSAYEPYGYDELAKLKNAIALAQAERAAYTESFLPPDEEGRREAQRVREEAAEAAAEALVAAREAEEGRRKFDERLAAEGYVPNAATMPFEEYERMSLEARASKGLPPPAVPQVQTQPVDWGAAFKSLTQAAEKRLPEAEGWAAEFMAIPGLLEKRLAPSMALKGTVENVVKRTGGVLNSEEAQPVGEAVSTRIRGLYESGGAEPGKVAGNKEVEGKLALTGAIATMEAVSGKAERNELTVDDILKLNKLKPKKPFWEQAKSALDMPLVGDENTLENMRLVRLLQPKLQEEVRKIQEDDGWVTVTVNGRKKQEKLDLRDPANLEKWQRDRAEQLATEYRLKMQPKIEAERKKTEEFIASRSPVVAKATKLISDGFIDSAPRMTPSGSDEEGFRAFQLKYGYPTKRNAQGEVTEAEFTTDSYQNLIADYKNQMERMSSGARGSSMEGGLGFMVKDLLMPNLDVLLPVFAQAADPTLDQRERYDRLKKFAGALDAVSVELAKRGIPKFLATKGDAEVLKMLNQQVASKLSEPLASMRQKEALLKAEEQRQFAIKQSLTAAPVVMATESITVQGIDDIAAMEFGPKRRKS